MGFLRRHLLGHDEGETLNEQAMREAGLASFQEVENASSDNRFAYVSSLGSDRVFSFALVEDAAGLRALEHGETRVPAGFGPRHLQFARDGRALVVVS